MRDVDPVGVQQTLPLVRLEPGVEELQGEDRGDRADLPGDGSRIDPAEEPRDQRRAHREPREQPDALTVHAAATALRPPKKRRCQSARFRAADSR